MERERAHFDSTIEERRKKEKEFGKFIKNYKKDMKNNK
jgi:ribosome biogenesis GTPase / thiamine phosphate phosphatase